MDAIECIKSRRSVRVYDSRPIAKEIIEDLIDCGRLAPSAINIQPWEFVAVTDRENLKKISALATYGSFIKDAGACIIVCGDKKSKFLLEDGGAATENIMLAAKAHSLGTCWVAGWQRTYNDHVKALLGIPEHIEIIAYISVGYPKTEAKSPPKRKLSEVLHWEKF
jgi:nitroreductase